MSDDETLRKRVREAIDAGKLPDCSPVGMWGGPGCGASCAICGKQIGIEEVEFELEFSAGNEFGCLQVAGNRLNGNSASNGAHSNGNGHGAHANDSGKLDATHLNGKDNLHMHLRCHAAWDVARQESEQPRPLMVIAPLPTREHHGTITGREREPRAERGPA
jgi:hypothetical protein